MPRYSNATYAGETRVLQNDHMRVEVHNRKTGWAFTEIYTPEGKLMGVLPYLGALQDNAGGARGNMAAFRRMDSYEVVEEHNEDEDTLVFQVHSLTTYDFAKGSFIEYMSDKNEKPLITGTIRMTLPKRENVLHLDYDLFWTGSNGFVALRGPWLLAGSDSFGLHKTDAIFPGIEWLRKDEWSSSHNYMLPPLSERTAPHPFKVCAPIMAVSYEGDAIALSWDPLFPMVERRPMLVDYYPQPVFSSPDAVNHADDHLMGLMLPSSAQTMEENNVYPKMVTPFHRMSKINFRAEISLSKGNSLDAYKDWVIRHGLPEPPAPREGIDKMLERIMHAFDTNLWVDTPETKGWAIRSERDMARAKRTVVEPACIERFLNKYPDEAVSKSLKDKLEAAREHSNIKRSVRDPMKILKLTDEEAASYGDGIISLQNEDGSFSFDPNNEKSAGYYKPGINHWPFSENLYKELCTIGDTSLETNVVAALHLLLIGKILKDKKYNEAAFRSLDYCLDMQVADGGDSWETPFHSPNLLATGHACIAYELAYRASGNEEYRKKAIYWLRGYLVFTHLWEPRGIHDLYCTKPCFCATDWATTSWVDCHVQWEAIQTLALAHELGIDWAEVDTEIDWHRYSRGIVAAVSHWMLDSGRAKELPYDIDLEHGNFDGTFSDVHDPITGESFGWQVFPDYLANLIMDIQNWDAQDR